MGRPRLCRNRKSQITESRVYRSFDGVVVMVMGPCDCSRFPTRPSSKKKPLLRSKLSVIAYPVYNAIVLLCYRVKP